MGEHEDIILSEITVTEKQIQYGSAYMKYLE